METKCENVLVHAFVPANYGTFFFLKTVDVCFFLSCNKQAATWRQNRLFDNGK